jgi:2',3'-cyclic-nucleotide 2'-phosphodiesterase (5'-nucleotidase family)
LLAQPVRADTITVSRKIIDTDNILGPTHFSKLRLPEMTPYLDFYNLMGYDYAGLSQHERNQGLV